MRLPGVIPELMPRLYKPFLVRPSMPSINRMSLRPYAAPIFERGPDGAVKSAPGAE